MSKDYEFQSLDISSDEYVTQDEAEAFLSDAYNITIHPDNDVRFAEYLIAVNGIRELFNDDDAESFLYADENGTIIATLGALTISMTSASTKVFGELLQNVDAFGLRPDDEGNYLYCDLLFDQ